MIARMLPEAENDLTSAFDHYYSLQSGLGRQFLAEFRRGVDRIIEFPFAWQPMGAAHRRYRLHRFPYGIVYRVDSAEEEFRIVAVMHLHQDPSSWRK
jgi:plasmid stabilization system protein ParE